MIKLNSTPEQLKQYYSQHKHDYYQMINHPQNACVVVHFAHQRKPFMFNNVQQFDLKPGQIVYVLTRKPHTTDLQITKAYVQKVFDFTKPDEHLTSKQRHQRAYRFHMPIVAAISK